MSENRLDQAATAERWLEATLFASRWLMAPFYLGLVVALAILLVVFVNELVAELWHIANMTPESAILLGLSLIDLSLAGNLLLIVIASSYQNFVAHIATADHPRWPGGLIGIGFAGLKQKLLGSIVAIAAINVLEWFMDIDRIVDNVKLGWVVGILLVFAVAMLVLAIADRVGGEVHEKNGA